MKKCKVRFSLMKKNKAFQKSYMKVVVKKVLRAGMMQARTREGSHGEVLIEETDGSSSRQKEYDFPVPSRGSIWL